MKNDADDVLKALDVSRETSDRLRLLADLLLKWNPRINLVSKASLDTLWTRHILDSAQIYDLAPHPVGHWVDIGSGGGFPGLVIAILAAEKNPDQNTTLIESDQRKCAFLRTVLRETGVKAKVLAERIEEAAPQNADVLSARALADLSQLCTFAERHLQMGGVALFPKGVTWQKELGEVEESWSFRYEVSTSKSEPEAVVLKLGDIRRD